MLLDSLYLQINSKCVCSIVNFYQVFFCWMLEENLSRLVIVTC